MASPPPPWLRFFDETSKIVTALTALVCLYTRSAGVVYFAAGALVCALSAKIVKKAIRQQRPTHGQKTYGMPSTHASACTFFAVSVLLASLHLPVHPSLHPLVVFAPLVVVPWASMIVLSRVWLGYHTGPQVAAGVAFGICFASMWFKMWAEDTGGIGTLGRRLEALDPVTVVLLFLLFVDMSLRRFAQVNAANAPGSPHSPSPHLSSDTQTPATPRTRVSYLDSPSATPSISSSTPFDWEAARSRRPPPYATPLSAKRKARMSVANAGGSPRKAIIRKKGFVERISEIPSRVMFEISLFPHNVPLPAPKTSAWLIGALMHTLHFSVRVSQVRATSDSDLGWEDLYLERNQQSWFDWTVPTTCMLLVGSTLNALHLFSQTRTYQLHRRTRADPVNSARATFVPSPQRDAHVHGVGTPKSTFAGRIAGLLQYMLLALWRVLVSVVRFLLGFSFASPSTSSPPRGAPAEAVQQLEMWVPGELERTLVGVYSPVHALLWMCTNGTNWVAMWVVMCAVWVQTGTLIEAYEGLVKDKGILAAEVMHEYNEGFVYPRTNPVRRDVAVMTHESEMVL